MVKTIFLLNLLLGRVIQLIFPTPAEALLDTKIFPQPLHDFGQFLRHLTFVRVTSKVKELPRIFLENNTSYGKYYHKIIF